jgi:hypothetical protein
VPSAILFGGRREVVAKAGMAFFIEREIRHTSVEEESFFFVEEVDRTEIRGQLQAQNRASLFPREERLAVPFIGVDTNTGIGAWYVGLSS